MNKGRCCYTSPIWSLSIHTPTCSSSSPSFFSTSSTSCYPSPLSVPHHSCIPLLLNPLLLLLLSPSPPAPLPLNSNWRPKWSHSSCKITWKLRKSDELVYCPVALLCKTTVKEPYNFTIWRIRREDRRKKETILVVYLHTYYFITQMKD